MDAFTPIRLVGLNLEFRRVRAFSPNLVKHQVLYHSQRRIYILINIELLIVSNMSILSPLSCS